ncbi:NAD(+) diphosphatase [Deinococcus lacus]|uniref:NAD(+) diphosphatase n=1 Tax=Deinococcus lacus TaxID=392561 RepID=A0ABW1YET8_9DEIO
MNLSLSRPPTFEPGHSPLSGPASGQVLLLDGSQLALTSRGEWPAWSPELPGSVFLGYDQGQGLYAARATGGPADPSDLTWHSLRALAQSDDPRAGLGGYAAQVLDFYETHRFCGRCGSELERLSHEIACRCGSCGLSVYPRVAPAVMVLVTRAGGQEVLLARGPRHKPGVYSALAGFTEPSESLEDCCRREVLEEVGVQINHLRYVLSQPWPFPHSLMIAFHAEYVGGDIVPQPGEIEEARWFSAGQLPSLPPSFSCSYQLIRAVLGGP